MMLTRDQWVLIGCGATILIAVCIHLLLVRCCSDRNQYIDGGSTDPIPSPRTSGGTISTTTAQTLGYLGTGYKSDHGLSDGYRGGLRGPLVTDSSGYSAGESGNTSDSKTDHSVSSSTVGRNRVRGRFETDHVIPENFTLRRRRSSVVELSEHENRLSNTTRFGR